MVDEKMSGAERAKEVRKEGKGKQRLLSEMPSDDFLEQKTNQ